MRSRHYVCLDVELAEKVRVLAEELGESKSAIMAEALRGYFKRRSVMVEEEDLKPRLDRIAKQLRRVQRSQFIFLETIALYIRFHFTIVPPLAEFEHAAAKALGNSRFETFINQVGRRVGTPKSVANEIFNLTEENQT